MISDKNKEKSLTKRLLSFSDTVIRQRKLRQRSPGTAQQ